MLRATLSLHPLTILQITHMTDTTTDNAQVIVQVQHWLTEAVIGLNLCPFAKSVYVKNQIRYVVSAATSITDLEFELAQELALLAASLAHQIDTTLLIHPHVLQGFFDYNDFLDTADEVLERLELVGELQVASFHPEYLFADAPADDISHYTNRAPYPILHLLREASIDKAVKAYPDAALIYERNIETLNRLGLTGWQTLMGAATQK